MRLRRWRPGHGMVALYGLAGAAAVMEAVLAGGWLRTFALWRNPGIYQSGDHPLIWILGNNLRAAAHFDLLLAGLILPYGTGLLLSRRLSGRAAVGVALAGSFVFNLTLLFTFPVGSTDLFHNVIDGRMLWLHHLNPLVTAPAAVADDPLYGYVTYWNDVPSTYGPLWYLATWPAAVFAGTGRDANIIWFKTIPVAFEFLSLILIWPIMRRANPRRTVSAIVCFGWNPLVLFEISGNGHNDSMMLAFLLLAVLLAITRRWWPASLLALSASILVKYVSAVFLPLLFIWLLRRHGRAGVLPMAIGAIVALALSIAALAPFWRGAATFAQLGKDSNLFHDSPAAAILSILLTADHVRQHSFLVITATKVGMLSLFTLAAAAILWKTQALLGDLMDGLVEISFLFLVLMAGWFWPWYCTMLVGAGALAIGRRHGRLAILFSLTALQINRSEAWDIPPGQLGTPLLVFLLPVAYAWRYVYWPSVGHRTTPGIAEASPSYRNRGCILRRKQGCKASRAGRPKMEQKFGAISADGHLRVPVLPFDLWSKRLPSKFKENGPRVVETPEGGRQWVIEGRRWSPVGLSATSCYARAGIKVEPEPGVFRTSNAKLRCEDMDRDGVDAELVNGPYELISTIQDPELRTAVVRVVNDWARELYEESSGRFIMLLPLPSQTPEEAVAEIERVATFGLPTGVIFDWAGAPEPVLHQMWEPVWAAAAEAGLPINFHANPSGGSRQIGVGVTSAAPRNQQLMRVVNFPMGPLSELMSALVFAGICDRHPKARFILEEAGVGWVPYMFFRFDQEYGWGGGEPFVHVFPRDIHLSAPPTEFIKRQIFFTFEVETEGGFRRLPEMGLDNNFLWASDFPGADSPWPNSKTMGHEPVRNALGEEALRQLVFENTVNLYKIPVSVPQTAR